MRRWLALGVAVVGMAWGPYLYTELSPRKAQSVARSESKLMAATDVVEVAPVQPLGARTAEPPAAEPAPPSAAEWQGATPTELMHVAAEEPSAERGAPEPPRNQEQGAPAAAAQPGPPPWDGKPDAVEGSANAPAAANAAAATDPSGAPRDAPRAATSPAAAEPARAPSPRVFNTAFESERRDGAWADEQEPSISQLMAAVGVAREDIVDVACRRSVCRVSFKPAQLDAEVAAALQAKASADFAQALLESHDAQSEHGAVLYLLRSGHALEPQPE